MQLLCHILNIQLLLEVITRCTQSCAARIPPFRIATQTPLLSLENLPIRRSENVHRRARILARPCTAVQGTVFNRQRRTEFSALGLRLLIWWIDRNPTNIGYGSL